jgi:hypothetical protein
MSTADRQDASTPDVATRLRDAGFVRLIAAADGDSAAAAGLFAMALAEHGVPYQTSVTPVPERADRDTDADLTIAVGRDAASADLAVGLDGSATREAAAVAREFDAGGLVLALAGTVAAEGHPGDRLAAAAAERGIERRPGVGVPTGALVDGLAHSTLVHAPFSGDQAATRDALDGIDVADPAEETGRAVASQVALSVAGDPEGTPTGTERVERLLRPLAGGPFHTIEGYADVLDAVAREQPGLALAVALGGVDRERALDVWRAHGDGVHEALQSARTARYDGLFVAYCDGRPPVASVARLLAGYRSPEPVTLVVGDGVAAARGRDETDVGAAIERTAAAVDGDGGASNIGGGTPARGRALFDADTTEFVAAFKEAV